jgi:hypothetical protein
MPGYSGKTIVQKLGVKPGHRVYLEKIPDGLPLEWPESVTVLRRSPAGPVDMVWAFFLDRRRLDQRLDTLVDKTATAGSLWISWPKKSSGVATDLSENVVRQAGLDAGVVDVKIAAVDETWSALKFVRRLKDR